MRLARAPSRSGLEQAYASLQWGEAGPAELVLWAQWSRLDPRLAEIEIRYLLRSFRKIPPLSLWEENRVSTLPAALAVLVDFARVHAVQGLPAAECAAFQAWARAVVWKTPKAPPQMFFVREGKPRPERDLRELAFSLRNFSRWGFFGRSPLVEEKGEAISQTMLSVPQRREILRVLARRRESFTVADFMQACEGRVHRRAAERDLKECAEISRFGATRAARYRRRSRGGN